MLKKLLAGFMVFFSVQAFALSEANYAQEYKEKIVPLINSMTKGSFVGERSLPIHFATYTTNPNSVICMVILPGRTEALEKYAEVVHDLDRGVKKGVYKFFLMDHRGQGSSGRMDKVPSEIGYVDEFNNYVLDVKNFMDNVVAVNNCSQKFLLAHSLGAGIAVSFMQQYPEYFDRAALSSPMLKIQTAPYSYKVARSIVLASMAAGRGKKLAIGQETFSGIRDFEANNFTTSKERYEMAMNMFDMIPEARLGGVSNRWLNEIMKGTKEIRKNYSDLKIPLRVFQAGIETYSHSDEMVKLCDEASYCKRVYLPDSKHEVLMDRDVNRNVVIHELETFFN